VESPRPLLILSNIILDDVVLPGGVRRHAVLGGAASYAATGALGWWPHVAIVAGVGSDFDNVAGRHFATLGIRREGMLERDRLTIRNTLLYRDESDRSETPVFGAAHFERMQTTPDDIPEILRPAAGTYLFRDLSASFWDAFERHRAALGTTLWELQASVATAHSWPGVRARLSSVDFFSLNLTEAVGLLGTSDVSQVIGNILSGGARSVILRMGAAGALIATSSGAVRLYPPASAVVDVTGAGNSFCGGFLAQWCATGDFESAARAGAAAAAQCMGAFGPPDRVDKPALTAWAAATRIEPFSP
jgi:sugar/nucleoside kinase (ribokinase family)